MPVFFFRTWDEAGVAAENERRINSMGSTSSLIEPSPLWHSCHNTSLLINSIQRGINQLRSLWLYHMNSVWQTSNLINILTAQRPKLNKSVKAADPSVSHQHTSDRPSDSNRCWKADNCHQWAPNYFCFRFFSFIPAKCGLGFKAQMTLLSPDKQVLLWVL